MVLHELKQDVALRRTWVETLIALFIVGLVEDDLILTLSHFQVIGSTVHTQRVGLQTSRDTALGQRIGVDGDEEVGLVAVGNVSTRMQGDEDIGLTGIDDAHVRTVAFHQPSEGQRHIQIDMFLLGQRTYRTSVRSSMSGINDQREFLVCSCSDSGKHQRYPYKS